MTNLKTLGLSTKFTFKTHLEDIARNLKELRHFEFGCSVDKCGLAKEKELVPKLFKFVKTGEKLVKLTLKFHVKNLNIEKMYEELENIRQTNQNSPEMLHVVLQQQECSHNGAIRFEKPSLKNGKYVKMSYKFVPSFYCDL